MPAGPQVDHQSFDNSKANLPTGKGGPSRRYLFCFSLSTWQEKDKRQAFATSKKRYRHPLHDLYLWSSEQKLLSSASPINLVEAAAEPPSYRGSLYTGKQPYFDRRPSFSTVDTSHACLTKPSGLLKQCQPRERPLGRCSFHGSQPL